MKEIKKNFSKIFLLAIVFSALAVRLAQAETISITEPANFFNPGRIILLFLLIFYLSCPTLKSAKNNTSAPKQENPSPQPQLPNTLKRILSDLQQAFDPEENKTFPSSSRSAAIEIDAPDSDAIIPNGSADLQRRNTMQETLFFQTEFPAKNQRSEKSPSENILAPIYELAGLGKLELLRKKLESGTDVNERDTFFYETALHRAAKRGDEAIVRLLLESGANTRLKTTPYAETPLHFAISGRNPQVVRLLLQYGADPNAKDCFSRTPIQCARFYKDLLNIFNQETAGKNI